MLRRFLASRIIWCVLVLACGSVARGHETYLLLKALPGGTLEIEAGFSNNESPQGLSVTLRNRETGAVISIHKLPGDGFLTVPLPKAPYRVEFDAGPGHRISKVGPMQEEAAPVTKATEPEARVKPAEAAKPAGPVVAPTSGGDMQRMLIVAGIFFVFGAIAFALGYGAGRKSR